MMQMKKRKPAMIISTFAVISVLLCLNVIVRQKIILSSTYSELESRGYEANEISSVKIDHSYFRRIIGYNEWRISVEFEKEPRVFFWFTFKNHKMIFEGVSSEPMMNQEAVIEYSEKFKNGTLLTGGS